MTAIDDLIETIAKADSSSWDIADHVAAIPQKGEEGYRPLRDIANEIYERLGVEWSPGALGQYRQTAIGFPIESRDSLAPFTACKILRAHPEKLAKWTERNPGKRLSVEAARNLRGGTSTPKVDREEWRKLFSRAVKTMDDLAENDPAFAVDKVEQMLSNWRARFPKALAKGARHGLQAV